MCVCMREFRILPKLNFQYLECSKISQCLRVVLGNCCKEFTTNLNNVSTI